MQKMHGIQFKGHGEKRQARLAKLRAELNQKSERKQKEDDSSDYDSIYSGASDDEAYQSDEDSSSGESNKSTEAKTQQINSSLKANEKSTQTDAIWSPSIRVIEVSRHHFELVLLQHLHFRKSIDGAKGGLTELQRARARGDHNYEA